jgi:hypothetical protein
MQVSESWSIPTVGSSWSQWVSCVNGPSTSERLSLLFILLAFFTSSSTTLLCFPPSWFFSPYLEVFLWLQGIFFCILLVFLIVIMEISQYSWVILLLCFCWVIQHHDWVFPPLLLLWQELSTFVNIWYWPSPTVGSWWSQWLSGHWSNIEVAAEGHWTIMWLLLLFKLLLSFSVFFRVGLLLSMFAYMLSDLISE